MDERKNNHEKAINDKGKQEENRNLDFIAEEVQQ